MATVLWLLLMTLLREPCGTGGSCRGWTWTGASARTRSFPAKKLMLDSMASLTDMRAELYAFSMDSIFELAQSICCLIIPITAPILSLIQFTTAAMPSRSALNLWIPASTHGASQSRKALNPDSTPSHSSLKNCLMGSQFLYIR